MLENLHRKTLFTITLFGAKKYKTRLIFYFSPKVNTITISFSKKTGKSLVSYSIFFMILKSYLQIIPGYTLQKSCENGIHK